MCCCVDKNCDIRFHTGKYFSIKPRIENYFKLLRVHHCTLRAFTNNIGFHKNNTITVLHYILEAIID